MPPTERPVILLVAEAVTLAHFARIATLARALDTDAYRVVVASDPRFSALDGDAPLTLQTISSIATQAFATALVKGKPVYSSETLTRYVEEDLALIDRVKPDLVIGDFRLSLAVSAPLRRVPYVSVVNGYWSPYADTAYPVPDLPVTRLLGVGIAQRVFDLVRPLAFASHAAPLNRVRRKFGLPSLGRDLRTAYTWGDYTLYADIPEVTPTRGLPPNHRYLGPVLWSTQTPLPDWWERLPRDKPIVCFTLGSSGKADFLPAALKALARLPITLIVATVGRVVLPALPDNVFQADYLPMEAALRRSQLLICNGGSLTTYQALAGGVPVIGVCSNLDQLLNMTAIARLGCGVMLRAGGLAPATLRETAKAVLAVPAYTQAAARMGQVLEQYDSKQRFRDTVSELLGK
ncbi:MAG: glycosyltransferase [Gallionellaceae bacterium]|nr:glycosyltransferase [Gallionellaceae bacterium]